MDRDPLDLRSISSLLLRKSGSGLNHVASWIDRPRPRQNPALARWFADSGDRTLRLDYDLDGNSLVFDLGGYVGQWTSDIYSMYRCTIHVFEPVAEYAEGIRRRFSRNADIHLHQFGLAGCSQIASIGLDRDGSSILKPGRMVEEIELVRASDFLEQNAIGQIDLMKINIEGAEYDLLEHLIQFGVVLRIKNIQVQFHDFVPDAERRMRRIQADLARTHELTYQYPFVWENWRLKEQS
jgi:FkbM family methyltransferase